MTDLSLAVNVVSAIILPFVILVLRRSISQREHEHQETLMRLDRIENGLIARIERVESKIDTHLAWHLGMGKE